MAPRAVFLVALALVLLNGTHRAEDSPKLPSFKASVVLPLLERISIADMTYRNSLAQIEGILGKTGKGIGGGGVKTNWINFYFELDDKTLIDVGFVNDKLVGISARMPDGTTRSFYPKLSN